MAGIWSAIKSVAPGLSTSQSPRVAVDNDDDDNNNNNNNLGRAAPTEASSSSPAHSAAPAPVADPSSRSLPRRPSDSRDGKAGVKSQASTPPQSHSHHRSPSRLSRNSTSLSAALLGNKSRAKDHDGSHRDSFENADKTAGSDTATQAATTPVTAAAPVNGGTQVCGSVDTPRTPGSHSGINPLSQQIALRKNTEPSIPQRLSQMAEGIARASTELSRGSAPMSGGELNTKDSKSKRASSFLSKLSMRSGRSSKKDHQLSVDSDSEMGGGELRLHGSASRVFSRTSLASGGPLPGGGYVPRHKEPPRYIRTRANNKRNREFNHMFLAQELVGTRPSEDQPETENAAANGVNGDVSTPAVSVSIADAPGAKTGTSTSSSSATSTTGGAIWATEFSKDGKYLATAGRDHVVRVWAVISTPEERAREDEEAEGRDGEKLSAPVFHEQPAREFRGHTGEVLDLSWSKNNFLLSSSMDKTVRLWHVSRPECLCTFKHKDFVTRLAFHPRDDRFFLAGSLDTMLRLWSIPDQAVAFSAQLPDLVTAVAFSPDGKVAIAGLLNGMCMFYETEGLKLSSQVHVRSSRGKNAKGSKITGIQTIRVPPPDPLDANGGHPQDSDSAHEVRVLITSNDSRIRIYSLHDKTLQVKLKGHENQCSQISATFSDDGNYVICGSEDRKTFVWSLANGAAVVQDKDKWPCEYFEAHGDIVTTAIFAPTKTRMLLGQSGDPIYDLCNPPPVVLQSLEETMAIQASTTNDSDAPEPATPAPKRPEPSPAYIARSTHYDGHIIVTTGDMGIIKVFRQDCAFSKRRHDSWETGSLSRKLAGAAGNSSGYIGGAGLGRSASVLTRTSAGASSTTAHSRRGSLSGPAPERILTWRQGIENSNTNTNTNTNGETQRTPTTTPAPSIRTSSPARASGTNLASEARKQPYAGISPAAARTRDRAESTATSVGSPLAREHKATTTKDDEAAAGRPSAPPALHIATTTTTITGGNKARKVSSEHQQSHSQKLPLKLRRQDSTKKIKLFREHEEQEEPKSLPVPGFVFRSATGDLSSTTAAAASASGSASPTVASAGFSDSPTTPTGGGNSGSSFWNRWRGIPGLRSVSHGGGGGGGSSSSSSGGGGGRRASGPVLSEELASSSSSSSAAAAAADDAKHDGDVTPHANATASSDHHHHQLTPTPAAAAAAGQPSTKLDQTAAQATATEAAAAGESDSDVPSVPASGEIEREEGKGG